MHLFRYEAVDSYGEQLRSTMEETSSRNVVAVLESRGYQVTSVERAEPRSVFARRDRLTWEDLKLLNDQLAAITRSGLPMGPSLAALADEARNRRLKPVLEEIKRDLDAGMTLSEAVQKHPQSFSGIYQSLIEAGERAGNLTAVLTTLGNYAARNIEVKRRLKIALAYPLVVCLFAVGVFWFMLTNVVPVFAEIFQDFGAGLPAPTQLLVDMSDYVSSLGGTVALVVVAAIFLSPFIVQLLPGARPRSATLDRLLGKMVLYGKFFYADSMARFCDALSILLKGGVPIVQSLDLAGAASGNEELRRAVREATLHIEAGERIADAFEETRFFGHGFCWLLSTAEERGETERALDELAESYRREVAYYDGMLGTLLAPAIIVILGLGLSFFVFALYLPVFSLGDAISG